jgi:hypothetical protein
MNAGRLADPTGNPKPTVRGRKISSPDLTSMLDDIRRARAPAELGFSAQLYILQAA